MKILLINFFFIATTLAAPLPPSWRFEYNYGRVSSFYIEKQPSIVFSDTNIEQASDRHEFIYQYYLAPPWLDFSIGGALTGLQVEKPEDTAEQFQYITLFTNLGVNIPLSDYWSIKLVTEHFYTSMVVEDNTFGFRNLRGTQIYPAIEWLPFGTDMFLQISPYFKFPLWSDLGNRRETTIGLKLKLPFSAAQRFPSYAYQKAIIIRLFYTQMNLEFERDGFIPSEMDIRQYGINLGFNF